MEKINIGKIPEDLKVFFDSEGITKLEEEIIDILKTMSLEQIIFLQRQIVNYVDKIPSIKTDGISRLESDTLILMHLASTIAHYIKANYQEIARIRQEKNKAKELADSINKVKVGDTVIVICEGNEESYTLVATEEEANIYENIISTVSPFGTALLNSKEGETVWWNFGNNKFSAQIIRLIKRDKEFQMIK